MALKIFIFLSLSLLLSCASIKRVALSSIGKMFTEEGPNGNSFTRDADPILVEDSLPTMLKIIELMRDAAPDSPDLNFGAGQIAVMYAGGFLQTRMERANSFAAKKTLQMRAKAMYLRGRDSIVEGLRQRYRHKDFTQKFKADNLDEFLAMMTAADLPFLYWGALSWLGAFALDPFDFELLTSISRPILMLWRALQIDAKYASLHTSMITIMGALPSSQIIEAMAHSPQQVRPFFAEYYRSQGIEGLEGKNRRAIVAHHFDRSIALTKGQDPSPYVAMATWLKGKQTDPRKDKKLFREYLEKALAIKAEKNIANRLSILIYQQQAEYLLQRIDEYFL